MAYGILSIIAYVSFLIWVYITGQNGPENRSFEPITGKGAIDLAAAMGQAFSIQAFFIPILHKNNKPANYIRFTFLAYAIGCAVYFYIAFLGAEGTVSENQASGTVHTFATARPKV